MDSQPFSSKTLTVFFVSSRLSGLFLTPSSSSSGFFPQSPPLNLPAGNDRPRGSRPAEQRSGSSSADAPLQPRRSGLQRPTEEIPASVTFSGARGPADFRRRRCDRAGSEPAAERPWPRSGILSPERGLGEPRRPHR